jgi:hypothetical protein
MSLPITLLLLVVAFISTVATLRVFPRPSSRDGSYGILLGFCAAVAAAIFTDFHNPNSGSALLFGLVTAVIAPPVATGLVYLLRRLFTGRR